MTPEARPAVLYRAFIVCSDEGCEAEFEVIGPLEEIEALTCDCGAGMHVMSWPVPVEAIHS